MSFHFFCFGLAAAAATAAVTVVVIVFIRSPSYLARCLADYEK